MDIISLLYLALKILTVVPTGSTISRRIPPHETTWTYSGELNGISHWADVYPECNGTRQSPIDIKTSKVQWNKGLNLELSGFQDAKYNAFIENNGHTVHLGLRDRIKPILTGSVVRGKVYVFAQLHFHWGKHPDAGSEHSIDNIFFPLEMHIVFYNQEYGNFDSALNHDDGLVVLGVLFQHSRHSNPALSSLIETIKRIPRYRDMADLPGGLDLSHLLPRNTRNFFTYRGSLTTPPCSEVVDWIILADPVNIADQQTEVFRHERTNLISPRTGDYAYLEHNYRDQVALNGRVVQASFDTIYSDQYY